MERTLKFISQLSPELGKLKTQITEMENKINHLNKKSTLLTEKRIGIDQTILVISDETNNTANTISKSKRYSNKIAFCDKISAFFNQENLTK